MKKVILFTLLWLSSFSSLKAQKEIANWLILGPFDAKNQSVLLTEQFIDEAKEKPRGGKVSSGKIWRLFKGNYLDFYNPILSSDNLENSVYYAAIYINNRSLKSAEKLFKISYSEGISIYVNGIESFAVDALGGLDVVDENIYITLKPGWNTVLIRLFNTKGDFYLKSGFEDEYNLIAQTDDPFPVNKNEYFPLRIIPIEDDKLNSITLTENGRFLMNMNKSYFNSSTSEAEKLKYQLFSNNEKIISKSIGKIKGGEIFGFGFNISIDELIQKQKPKFEIKLFNKEKEILTDSLIRLDLFQNFVAALFSPIPIRGWEREVIRGKVVFTREFIVPPALDNLGIDLFVDIGSNLSTIKINNVVLKEKFWEESGDVVITQKARQDEKIKIEIIADPKDKNNNPVSLRYSCLYIRNKNIEKILGNILYSKRLGMKAAYEQRDIYNLIYDYLIKKDDEKIIDLLTDVESKTKVLFPDIKKYNISHVGNAHIDMAWLWRYPETIEVTRQTFKAALNNMATMPFFKFTHGQAQSYEWMERYYPAIFKEINKYVNEGRWELIGGTWVENDLNMSSGEFTLRQFLYGKQYFYQKFGKDIKIAYSPDTFGHPESMPAILNACGIEKYIFFRPYEKQKIFYWKSKDGSVVLAHRPSGWFTSYDYWNRSNIVPDKKYYKNCFEADTLFNLKNNLRFYGVGDHGGGPTLKEIEHIKFLDTLQSYPSNTFNTVDEYYKSLNFSELKIDTFRNEINPIFEGCYTSQAKMKLLNRKTEFILPLTEMFSVISEKYGSPYPTEDLKYLWKKALFNQFHDILPGSAVAAVYRDAENDYDTIFVKCDEMLNNAFQKIAANINTKSAGNNWLPVIVFNNLNWKRNAPVEVVINKISGYDAFKIFDDLGKEIPSQVIRNNGLDIRLLFIAHDVPSIGYKTFWIKPEKNTIKENTLSVNNGNYLKLENGFYKVSIDQISGSLYSIYDKRLKQELLAESALGNQYQIQNDGGNAWEIKLSSEPEPIISPKNIKVIEDGRVRKIIRVEYQYGNSNLTQDIILYSELPLIYFKHKINWKERGKILKIIFPINISQPKAEFEIPFSSIERKCDGNEVVAQKYLSIFDETLGITFLNDSKYGCSVKDSVVSLTALRSPSDPDTEADLGIHEFTYAISSNTTQNNHYLAPRLGCEFNSTMPYIISERHPGKLPSKYSFIDVQNENIIITALKKSEDKKSNILRFYETSGKCSNAKINLFDSFKKITEIDAVEFNSGKLFSSGKSILLKIKPFEIKSILFSNTK